MRDLMDQVLIFDLMDLVLIGPPLLIGFGLGYWVRSRQSLKRRLRLGN
jgi:hypothetical protein